MCVSRVVDYVICLNPITDMATQYWFPSLLRGYRIDKWNQLMIPYSRPSLRFGRKEDVHVREKV